MPLVLAGLLTTIIRLVVGMLIVGGFVWLVVRLLARMTGMGGTSPPGRKPADRVDDDEREIY